MFSGAGVAGGAEGAGGAVAGVVWVISGRYPTRGYPGSGGQGLSRSTSAERPCIRRRKVCPEAISVALLTPPARAPHRPGSSWETCGRLPTRDFPDLGLGPSGPGWRTGRPPQLGAGRAAIGKTGAAEVQSADLRMVENLLPGAGQLYPAVLQHH